MSRELIYTTLIYAVLIVLAASSWLGLALALGWVGVGCWFVLNTNSRGFLADVSFVATWPLYVALGR